MQNSSPRGWHLSIGEWSQPCCPLCARTIHPTGCSVRSAMRMSSRPTWCRLCSRSRASRARPSHGPQPSRVRELIAAQAWTDAALALVALDGSRVLRQLIHEDGEWHCVARVPVAAAGVARRYDRICPCGAAARDSRRVGRGNRDEIRACVDRRLAAALACRAARHHRLHRLRQLRLTIGEAASALRPARAWRAISGRGRACSAPRADRCPAGSIASSAAMQSQAWRRRCSGSARILLMGGPRRTSTAALWRAQQSPCPHRKSRRSGRPRL